MILLSPSDLDVLEENAILMLDSGVEIPTHAETVSVYIRGLTELDPWTYMLTGMDVAMVLKIVMTTMDRCQAVLAGRDLMGVSALLEEDDTPTDRLTHACQHASEVTASIIYNLVLYSKCRGGDVVHVSATHHMTPSETGVCIVAGVIISGDESVPDITLYMNGDILFQGDPGLILLEE